MRYHVRILARAEREANHIIDWIAERSTSGAAAPAAPGRDPTLRSIYILPKGQTPKENKRMTPFVASRMPIANR